MKWADVKPMAKIPGIAMHEAIRNATRWALGLHSPYEVEPGVMVCRACSKNPAWPCPPAVRMTEQLSRLDAA